MGLILNYVGFAFVYMDRVSLREGGAFLWAALVLYLSKDPKTKEDDE